MSKTRYGCTFPGCVHSVSRKADLRRHMETHDESTKSKHRCTFPNCDYHTRQRTNIKQHLEACHGIIMPLSRKPPNKTRGRGGRRGTLKDVTRLVEGDANLTERMYSTNTQSTTFEADPLSETQGAKTQEATRPRLVPASNDSITPAAVNLEAVPFALSSGTTTSGTRTQRPYRHSDTMQPDIAIVTREEDPATPMAPTEAPRKLVAHRQLVELPLHRPLKYALMQYKVQPYADIHIQQHGPGYFAPYYRIPQRLQPMIHARPIPPQHTMAVNNDSSPSMDTIVAHQKHPKRSAAEILVQGMVSTLYPLQ